MDTATKKMDVQWNKDDGPVNWSCRDWPLYKPTMMRYLACYEVNDNEWRLYDIYDGSVTFQSTVSQDEEPLSEIDIELAVFDYGSEMWEYLAKRFEGRENATTKLYMERTLRQKLHAASCCPVTDVENRLLYMMSPAIHANL
ncbi:Multidrug resistance protein ABC Superfamily [Phytophthora palmivora]|uniref:Multidrug resistance protein ABC Superfamily n=1 Tax=Phytophthora palmivora TaxID=4796 RepID=A0A2P4Y9F8_9STRA|nr:Multidrug resistance protein ABC Superfamily [Phytophthora palmivora]